jgi:hypothetical protein
MSADNVGESARSATRAALSERESSTREREVRKRRNALRPRRTSTDRFLPLEILTRNLYDGLPAKVVYVRDDVERGLVVAEKAEIAKTGGPDGCGGAFGDIGGLYARNGQI